MRSAFDLVLFDLDDTLVPVLPPLQAAAATLAAYMALHLPEALAAAQLESAVGPEPVPTPAALTKALSRRMHALAARLPSLAHDLGEVRRLALVELVLQVAWP